MSQNLNNGKVYNLFMYNINILKKKNTQLNFIEKREASKEFFKKNKKKYDLILIDGDHSFKNIMYDIRNSIKFCKDKGYIFGDDYEIEASKLSLKKLRKFCNSDLEYCSKNKKEYHPGITLAVKLQFSNLKSKNGIFGVQKVNNKFNDLYVR